MSSPSLVSRSPIFLRVLTVVVLVAALLLACVQIAYAQPTPTPTPQPSGGAVNPFDGVNPDIGLLGPTLNSTWKRLLAAAWGVALAVTGFNVMTSFLSFKKAKSRGMPGDLSDASADLKLAGAGLAGTAAAGVIVGAILFLVQG